MAMSYLADSCVAPGPSVTLLAAEFQDLEDRCNRGEFPGDIPEDICARMVELTDSIIRTPAASVAEILLKLGVAALVLIEGVGVEGLSGDFPRSLDRLSVDHLSDCAIEEAMVLSAALDCRAIGLL